MWSMHESSTESHMCMGGMNHPKTGAAAVAFWSDWFCPNRLAAMLFLIYRQKIWTSGKSGKNGGHIICFTSWKNSKVSGSGLNGNMIFDHEPLDFGVREPISGQSHLSSVQFPCWLTIGSGIKNYPIDYWGFGVIIHMSLMNQTVYLYKLYNYNNYCVVWSLIITLEGLFTSHLCQDFVLAIGSTAPAPGSPVVHPWHVDPCV